MMTPSTLCRKQCAFVLVPPISRLVENTKPRICPEISRSGQCRVACSGRLLVVRTPLYIYWAFVVTLTFRSAARANTKCFYNRWYNYLSMLKIILPTVTAVSLCLLAILLNFMTPATAGPFGILLVFVFVYLSSFGLVAFFLFGMSRVLSHILAIVMARKPFSPMSLKKSCIYSSVVSTAPVMLIALRSVGVVGLYEYLLVVAFIVIGCLYISKRIV